MSRSSKVNRPRTPLLLARVACGVIWGSLVGWVGCAGEQEPGGSPGAQGAGVPTNAGVQTTGSNDLASTAISGTSTTLGELTTAGMPAASTAPPVTTTALSSSDSGGTTTGELPTAGSTNSSTTVDAATASAASG